LNPTTAPAELATADQRRPASVLLVGNPNVGKTSLFNALAGLRAKTANYPGITVDLREAVLHLRADERQTDCQAAADIALVDLPGMYSLHPASPEEQVAARRIHGELGGRPDCVVVVVDATNLSRTLVLASEILELNLPTVVAVNLIDAADAQEIEIQLDQLSQQLGCPVVAVSARTGRGLGELRETVYDLIKPVESSLPIARQSCVAGCTGCPYAARFDWADDVAGSSIRQPSRSGVRLEWLDRWLTSPWVGLAALLGVMLLVFFLIFSLADIPMAAIESCFGWLGDQVNALLPAQPINPVLWFTIASIGSLAVFAGAYKLNETSWNRLTTTIALVASVAIGLLPLEDFRSLLIEGVIGGVAGVVVFLPQICILFFFITLLEDSGYMARGAFVMERVMRRVGLPGKAFVPMLSAHACAIPGIMAARTIDTWRDRLVTILVLPLLTCSARLPVYVMVAALLFGDNPAQAALMFAGAYLLGLAAALGTAWVLKKTVVRGEASPLILELPQYRMPSFRNALFTMMDRAMVFLRQAGSTILLISVVLWAMATYPKLPETAQYNGELTRAQASLEYSLAGRAGRLVEQIGRASCRERV